jgi:biotin transporter BioY
MRVRARSGALALDAALKAALIGLLIFAAARQDLPQFHDKSMTGRAIGYPLAALVVPIGWLLYSRRRSVPFPVVVDILVVAPFVIDMAGNAANLYDTVSWWDDANHFVNWAILVGGFGVLLLSTRLDRWPIFGLAVGFGATTAILWELLEYVTFIRHSPELKTAYHDTLGDLALGLAGSVLAGAAVATLGRRARPVPRGEES